jgi:hypothetical protein
VASGFGVVSTGVTDPFNPTLTGLSDEEIAALPVLECPVGYYGPGGAVGAKCIPCGAGATTKLPGATSVDQCDGEWGWVHPEMATCLLAAGAAL